MKFFNLTSLFLLLSLFHVSIALFFQHTKGAMHGVQLLLDHRTKELSQLIPSDVNTILRETAEEREKLSRFNTPALSLSTNVSAPSLLTLMWYTPKQESSRKKLVEKKLRRRSW